MKHRFALALATVVASASTFADAPGPVVPGPGFPPGGAIPGGVVDPRLATKVYFDCAVGPGWLVMRVVDPTGFKHTENMFVGSRSNCLAQTKELRKTRATITEASTVAVCVTGGGPTFLRRRIVYPVSFNWAGYLTRGGVQPIADQEYPAKECQEYAAELNGTGAALPPGAP